MCVHAGKNSVTDMGLRLLWAGAVTTHEMTCECGLFEGSLPVDNVVKAPDFSVYEYSYERMFTRYDEGSRTITVNY